VANKYRKKPKQHRSKVTVDALLEATTHILLKGGVEALTTNHVAEMAGVSIGSLYQYFPNKASLIAALIEQHVDHEVSTLKKVFLNWKGMPGEQLFRSVINELIQIHLNDIELTKLLHQQVSYLECRQALREATKYFESIVEALLNAQFKVQLSTKEIKVRAFVVTNAIDSLIQLALVENTEILSEPYFQDELVKLVNQAFEV